MSGKVEAVVAASGDLQKSKEAATSNEEIFKAVKLLLKNGFYVAYEGLGGTFCSEMTGAKTLWVDSPSGEYEGKPSDVILKKKLMECKR